MCEPLGEPAQAVSSPVSVSGSIYFSFVLFVYFFFGEAGGGRGEALVMLLLRVLLGVREVKTLAPRPF